MCAVHILNVYNAHIVKSFCVTYLQPMIERTANLLGVIGLAVSKQIEQSTRAILKHTGETPAALVVIGYGLGPTNDVLRRILGLSHSGTVRLVDRLVNEGLVERRSGKDKREIALYVTKQGKNLREKILKERINAISPFVELLDSEEQETLANLIGKILSSMDTDDIERKNLCRLCDNRVCTNCPIPASDVPSTR